MKSTPKVPKTPYMGHSNKVTGATNTPAYLAPQGAYDVYRPMHFSRMVYLPKAVRDYMNTEVMKRL